MSFASRFEHFLSSVPWFEVTLGCTTFMFMLEIILEIRQNLNIRRHVHDPERYKLLPLTYIRVESTFGFLCECLALTFGLLAMGWDASNAYLDRLGFDSTYQLFRGVSYIFLVSFYSSLVRAPFELYRVLFLEPYRNGSLWKTMLIMASDQIKMFLVSVIVGVPLLSITLSMLYWDFPFQWLLASIFVSIVALGMTDAYRTVFAPMFNTYSVLPDSAFKSEVVKLCSSLHLNLREVYIIDGSTRVDHSSAFIAGLFKPSVVVYDTLLAQLSTQEALAVVGHEIGHFKFKHHWKRLLLQLISVGNFIFLFSRVINLPSFYQSYGFREPDAAVGLVLFSYGYSTFANFLNFTFNFITRRFEFAADSFAIENGLDMKRALNRLLRMNQSHSIPSDPWYSLYHDHHPSIHERLDEIDTYLSSMKKE